LIGLSPHHFLILSTPRIGPPTTGAAWSGDGTGAGQKALSIAVVGLSMEAAAAVVVTVDVVMAADVGAEMDMGDTFYKFLLDQFQKCSFHFSLSEFWAWKKIPNSLLPSFSFPFFLLFLPFIFLSFNLSWPALLSLFFCAHSQNLGPLLPHS
jgi:hypothetical protein